MSKIEVSQVRNPGKPWRLRWRNTNWYYSTEAEARAHAKAYRDYETKGHTRTKSRAARRAGKR